MGNVERLHEVCVPVPCLPGSVIHRSVPKLLAGLINSKETFLSHCPDLNLKRYTREEVGLRRCLLRPFYWTVLSGLNVINRWCYDRACLFDVMEPINVVSMNTYPGR